MRRCLQLAGLGAGDVSPNPMVGAVLLHKGRVIGEGYHLQYGGPHAEVNCINSVKDEDKQLIKESTLYVSLEPCTHIGKTPPCCDLIIKHEVREVVIACSDPFEKVNGTGIEKLKQAGIEVVFGVLEKEAMDLNKRFFTFHKKQRPYIILKWAQSSDLKIAAEGHSPVKISNEISNRLVHKWRSEEAAIMVGTNTALYDDPSLTNRLWTGKDPVRVVIDRHLKISTQLNLMDNSVPTIILNCIKQEEDGNNLFYKYGEDENVLAVAVNILRQRNINSLIVEGGSILLQSFIDAGLWDEARVITNTNLHINEGIAAPVLKDHSMFKKWALQSDEISFFKHSVI